MDSTQKPLAVTAAAGWLLVLSLAGCSTTGDGASRFGDGVGYYWQSMVGHLDLVWRARPIDEVLARGDLPDRTRERLIAAKAIRRFAVSELGLPDNGSYTRYTELSRPFVTWGVVAAPELSLTLTRWCFPVAGCVTYRGYYSLADAEAYAARLVGRGLDTAVNGVPAYSTLGWFDDPLLSTFVNYPDTELARLVFHELAHQVVYLKGDSTFNESFATAVEQLGIERWLAHNGSAAQRDAWLQQQRRRADFLALLSRHRERLATLYASDRTDAEKRAGKATVFADLRADYAALKSGAWGGFTGYDRWFDRPLGNAHLGAVSTYSAWVPAFLQLFVEAGEAFPAFYRQVATLARLPAAERQAQLERLRASRADLATIRGSARAD